MRQLREWILLLRTVLISLSNEAKGTMEEVMLAWRDRGRGGINVDGTSAGTTGEGDVSLPLGPGEWEDALGLPLCVVCQNVSSQADSYVTSDSRLTPSARPRRWNTWRRHKDGRRRNSMWCYSI